MSNKRKSEQKSGKQKRLKLENGNKLSDDVQVIDSRIFEGLNFYIHTPAVSKSRRTIFERQIPCHSGVYIESLGNLERCDKKNAILLLEDILITKDKLGPIVDKLQNDTNNKFDIVGLSWLSKCLENKSLIARDEYVLSKVRKIKTDPKIDKSDIVSLSESKCLKVERDFEIDKSAKDDQESEIVSGSSENWTERNKGKFVCAQSSKNPLATNTNNNQIITDELEKLAEAYKNSADTWRALGYKKAIMAIKAHPVPITCHAQAVALHGVGSKMADKVMEIVESGKLRKVEEVCNTDKMKIIELFMGVWGAGSVTAETWYQQGHRSLSDLSNAKLTKQQMVGLRLYQDLNTRMEREEAGMIAEEVRREALEIRQGLEVIACGSYRRGKATCGDLDLLITHPDGESHLGVFDPLIKNLYDKGFLTDHLSYQSDGNQKKYMGVCRLPGENKLHRRLDIIVIPYKEKATALMYFTGSAHFNRSMRLLATKMGLSLNEHGLRGGVLRSGKEKLNEGFLLETSSEESVFKHLGLVYRQPTERDH